MDTDSRGNLFNGRTETHYDTARKTNGDKVGEIAIMPLYQRKGATM